MPAALSEFLRFALGGALVGLPGVWAISALFPERPLRDRLTLGCTAGLACAVYLAIALAHLRLWLFYPAWLILGIAAAAAWLRSPARPRPRGRIEGRDLAVIAILGLVALTRFAIALRHELPLGWDPSFHLILARKMATVGGMIFDWRPFEDIALNYPLGSHALVVVLSQTTGIPLHAAFRLLIPALGVLSSALVYVFARNVSDDADVGLFSLLAYGLWAVYGSIDYYRWGGLPNLLGMTFVMGALLVLLHPSPARRETAVFSVLVAAIFLTHHHVMMTSGLVFVALAAYFQVIAGDKLRARIVVVGLLGSAVLGSFYMVPYALKAPTLGNTGTLAFNEMFYGLRTIVDSAGAAFLVASLGGLALHAAARTRSSPLGMLYVASATTLALFVFFEYGWRPIAQHLYGDPYVAFTPSRFLTDLMYFSSVFAGFGLAQLRRIVRLPLVLFVALCVPVAATNRTAWAKASVAPRSEPLMKVYAWIDRYTPADTLVLTDDAWAVYGTWRRCSVTPIPISEPSTTDTPKARLFEAISRGAVPREAAASKIVQVARPGTARLPGRILWRAPSGLAVVDITPDRPWKP